MTAAFAVESYEICGRRVHVIEMRQTRWLVDLRRKQLLRISREVPLDLRLLLVPWEPFVEMVRRADGTTTFTLDRDGRCMLASVIDVHAVSGGAHPKH